MKKLLFIISVIALLSCEKENEITKQTVITDTIYIQENASKFYLYLINPCKDCVYDYPVQLIYGRRNEADTIVDITRLFVFPLDTIKINLIGKTDQVRIRYKYSDFECKETNLIYINSFITVYDLKNRK